MEAEQTPGVRQRLHRFVKLARSDAGRNLSVTGHAKPEYWNEEVVRALGTRMPGGLTSVTSICKFCQSKFYPCLCETNYRDIPHTRLLVPPRVVREAEVRRLNSKPMGHLKELETSLDVCGMQKDTIIMVGPATGEEEQQDSLPLPSASNVKVLWREDKTYVVSETGAEAIYQTIDFSKEELKRLLGHLVERNNEFTVRERWHGRYIKPKDLHYTTMKEAVRDLNLIRVRTARQSFWEVSYVRHKGKASAAGLQAGHRIIDLSVSVKDPTEVDEVFRKIRDDSWTRWLDPEGTQIVPDVFLSLDFSPEKHKVDEALFPCYLIFDEVAPGAKALRAGLASKEEAGMADVDSDLFGKLAHQDQDTRVLFMREPRQRVSRHAAAVRHKHITEGAIFKSSEGEDAEKATGSFLEEAEESSEERLFDIWLASKGMTASQLKFTCRRLLESVRGELTNFERKKKERLETLLSKSLSCTKFLGELEEAFMKMIADLNRTCPSPDPSEAQTLAARVKVLKDFLKEELGSFQGSTAFSKEFKYKQDEIKAYTEEIWALFELVPLSFLSELEKMADDANAPSMTPSASPTRPASAKILKRANTRQQLREKAAQRKSLGAAQLLHVACWRDASKNFNECLSALPDLEKKWLQDALVFLKEQANKYKQSLQGRADKESQRDRRSSTASSYGPKKVTLPDMTSTSSEDGRLTLKEFEKVMVLSGVNWLGAQDFRELFESLDRDGSGKLSLGELLSMAMQLSDLAERLQRFCTDNADLSPENCLLEFRQQLKMGSDLVGTKAKPLIPDKRITFSSVFLKSGEHGHNQQWRSRLDCSETCWVAESNEKDLDPWIQWEFFSMREIRCISTRGRPDSDCWVEKYIVKYTDLDHDEFEDVLAEKGDPWMNFPEELEGNTDRNTRQDNILDPPIVAYRIRICPRKYHGQYPSMRASLFGSFRPSPAILSPK